MKTLSYIILIFFMIGIFLSGYFFAKNKYNVKNKTNVSLPSSIPNETSVTPTLEYKDDSGVNHVQFSSESNTFTKKEALRQTESLVPYIDSIAEGLKIKPKQIESNLEISTKTIADSIPFYKRQIDSLKRLVFFYNDKYLKLTVRSGSISDSLDNGSFDFEYNADLNINQFFRRNKVLGLPIGAKNSYIDISSKDPRTKIMGLNKFSIKQNVPEFGLRLQGTVIYIPYNSSTIIGPSVRLDFLKSSLRVGYYYNTSLNRWVSRFSIDKDIIRF